MRFFASILTVLVLLLTASPIVAHAKEIKKEKHCCKSKKTEEKKDNCCDKGCNPFLSCCGGMGFILAKSDFSLQEISHLKDDNNYAYLAIHSSYFNGMWQPPKIQC
jgi:hypothetical protein